MGNRKMTHTHDSNIKIRLQSVTQTYSENESETKALDNVSVDFTTGKFTSIVGPSGCGKSTLLSLVAGFQKPSSGTIFLDNKPLKGPGPNRGFVFQDYALFPWKTVLENIAFGLRINGKPRKEADDIAKQFLRMVNLEKFADTYPYALSGGMKQRVSIARALAYNPEVLLMDEPFGAVDAQTRKMLQKELVHILDKFNKTILFVTHSVLEAVFLSDVVVVMTAHPGKIKGVVPVTLPRPRNHSEKEYIEVRNHILTLLEEEVEKDFKEQSTLTLTTHSRDRD